MKHTLLVKAEAIKDMSEAFDWYETKRTGLGTEFLNEAEEFFDRIKQKSGAISNPPKSADSCYASLSV
jgi:hypothetical protein